MDIEAKKAINRLIITLQKEGISSIISSRLITSIEDHDEMADALVKLGVKCELSPHPSVPPGSIVVAKSWTEDEDDIW